MILTALSALWLAGMGAWLAWAWLSDQDFRSAMKTLVVISSVVIVSFLALNRLACDLFHMGSGCR